MFPSLPLLSKYLCFSTLLRIHELKERHRGIDILVFREFCQNHPALLYPVFDVQMNFQKRIMGHVFWAKLTKKRDDLHRGQYVHVSDIMVSIRFKT